MTPHLTLTAALLAGVVGVVGIQAGVLMAQDLSAARGQVGDLMGDLFEEQEATRRERGVADHWRAVAESYAKQVTAAQERYRTLDDKYTDLLNKHVDLQWALQAAERRTALQPEVITAAWPILRCESRFREDVVSIAVVNGVTYEQLGLMQLLWDEPMQELARELGYTREGLLKAGPNLHTAAVWAQRTDRGVPFRLWGCK